MGVLNSALLAMGAISKPLEILYTPAAMVLGMAFVIVPFMFLPLYAAIDNLDHARVETSLDLGANRIQTFIKDFLLQTLPRIMGAECVPLTAGPNYAHL